MENEIYNIIAAKISGEILSDGEQIQLKQWRKEGENEKEYQLLITMQLPIELVRAHGGISRKTAYRKVKERVTRHRSRRLRRYAYVSVAAVLLLFVGVGLIWKFQPFLFPQKKTTLQTPGSGQVVLTMKNGEKFFLKQNTNEVIRTDAALQITNEQNTLVYSGTGGMAKEMDYNTLTVPAGGEYRVILSDGTKVFLNSGTEFRYPETFQGERREVFLKGEAWFEVNKDSSRTFLVHTGAIDVRVLGTSFNVNAYDQLNNVAATLVAGNIEVICDRETFRIVPGEQFRYNKEEQKAEVCQVDTEMYTSWKDGYYKFRKLPLEEIMTTLSIWYGVNVSYLDEKIKQTEFTGRVKRYDAIDNLLRQFEQTGNVIFQQQGNNVVIQSK